MGDDPRYKQDRELVGRILAGSETDWHDFVDRYTALILSVLRRYVFDEEQVKNVWAGVLERLYHGQLRSYEGRSLLGTWLVFVARSAAIDHLRSRRGRPRHPANWDDLSPRDQFVYHELFMAQRDPEEVRHQLAARGELADGESLAEIVARLEESVGDRTLRRVAWDVHARSVGGVSGRLLEYLDQAAADAAERQDELSPERQLHHAQVRGTLARVHEAIRLLPEDERRAMELRYGEGLTAAQIGLELGIERPREVYTLLDRAVRSIRKLMGLNMLIFCWSLLVFFR